MAGKLYVGDIGTEIILDVGEEIPGASVLIYVMKPNGFTSIWSSSVYAIDGSSRYVRHTIVADDFDVSGVYLLQPFISIVDGTWSGRGETVKLNVYDHYK